MSGRAHAAVEGRLLVRILAVAQVCDLLVGVRPGGRKALIGARREPCRDRRLIARGAGECLGGQTRAQRQRQQSPGPAQCAEHLLVVGRVDDHGRKGAVLGGRADHRRPADVDVLDDLRRVGVAARDGLLEGVQVHAHQIDLLDLLLGRGLQVGVLVATGEQPRIEAWMKRLDAPLHDLGEAGELLDRAHGHAGAGELARRASRGDDLHAQTLQAAGEVDDPALV